MKLVLLELVIVVVAVRVIGSLEDASFPAATPWELLVGLAALALGVALALAFGARKTPAEPTTLVPPHIPLERIGPYRGEIRLVRFGARGPHDIHLN